MHIKCFCGLLIFYNIGEGDDSMKKVNVTFRVDDELKKQADSLFADLGMNLSTTLNIFLRQAVREQNIPFQVTKNVPNAVTLAAMETAEKNDDMYGPFDNIDDLLVNLSKSTGKL